MMHQKIEASDARGATLSAFDASCELDTLENEIKDYTGVIWLASTSDDLDDCEKKALRAVERQLLAFAANVASISERLHPSPISSAR